MEMFFHTLKSFSILLPSVYELLSLGQKFLSTTILILCGTKIILSGQKDGASLDMKFVFRYYRIESTLKIDFEFWKCPIFDNSISGCVSRNQTIILVFQVYKSIELYLSRYEFPQLLSCYSLYCILSFNDQTWIFWPQWTMISFTIFGW